MLHSTFQIFFFQDGQHWQQSRPSTTLPFSYQDNAPSSRCQETTSSPSLSRKSGVAFIHENSEWWEFYKLPLFANIAMEYVDDNHECKRIGDCSGKECHRPCHCLCLIVLNHDRNVSELSERMAPFLLNRRAESNVQIASYTTFGEKNQTLAAPPLMLQNVIQQHNLTPSSVRVLLSPFLDYRSLVQVLNSAEDFFKEANIECKVQMIFQSLQEFSLMSPMHSFLYFGSTHADQRTVESLGKKDLVAIRSVNGLPWKLVRKKPLPLSSRHDQYSQTKENDHRAHAANPAAAYSVVPATPDEKQQLISSAFSFVKTSTSPLTWLGVDSAEEVDKEEPHRCPFYCDATTNNYGDRSSSKLGSSSFASSFFHAAAIKQHMRCPDFPLFTLGQTFSIAERRRRLDWQVYSKTFEWAQNVIYQIESEIHRFTLRVLPVELRNIIYTFLIHDETEHRSSSRRAQ